MVNIGEGKVELSNALGMVYHPGAVQELTLDQDVSHLCALPAAVDEYLFHYMKDAHDMELLQCLTLVVSLKSNYPAFTQQLLEEEPDPNRQTRDPASDVSRRLPPPS